MHIGSSVIIPIVFAFFSALFLYPIHTRIMKIKLIPWDWLGIILSFLLVIIPLLFIGVLVSMQLMDIAESLPVIGDNLVRGVQKVLDKVSSFLPERNLEVQRFFSENIQSIVRTPIGWLGKGIVTSSEFMVSLGLCMVYTFFFLYYRKAFENFTVHQFAEKHREEVRKVLSKIKDTVQSYVGGLALVMVILAFLNSLGLYIIGIKHPIFWGVLGGMLAIIPYIGSILGGLLPFLYALATTDTSWQPMALIIYYIVIQQIEGNLITPNIIGNQVNINPLIAIVALVALGSFWGIGGVILALPIISIVRIILLEFRPTRDFGKLMGADLAQNPDKFG